MRYEREEIIRAWFGMWLEGRDTGIDGLFAPDCVYVESWGPRYDGIRAVKHWFGEWNTRGKVLVWEIKQFFHRDNQTAVEWYFRCTMEDAQVEHFDGVSIVEWGGANKIKYLKEFACKLPHYDPYADGDAPGLNNTGTWG